MVVHTALFVVFTTSFFHPRTGRDWWAMSPFTAVLVALFTETYGIPLTVYLLSGWLGAKVPALQATHSGGHLWNDLASYAFIGGGFWLISAAWQKLHDAARTGTLASTGPFARVRHHAVRRSCPRRPCRCSTPRPWPPERSPRCSPASPTTDPGPGCCSRCRSWSPPFRHWHSAPA
jgi:hypothetical protein